MKLKTDRLRPSVLAGFCGGHLLKCRATVLSIIIVIDVAKMTVEARHLSFFPILTSWFKNHRVPNANNHGRNTNTKIHINSSYWGVTQAK